MQIDLSDPRIKQDKAALVFELERLGAQIPNPDRAFRCPFHDDKNPSASIYEGKDGVWRFKCHVPTCKFGSGSIVDVVAWFQEKDPNDLLREHAAAKREREGRSGLQNGAQTQNPAHDMAQGHRAAPHVWKSLDDVERFIGDRIGKIEAKYSYTDPDTLKLDFVKYRIVPRDGSRKKDFQYYRPVPGGFVAQLGPGKKPIYNRSRVKQAQAVVICEGEKCVHALHPYGIVATTAFSGAKSAPDSDWNLLAGKRVYLWPDNDDAAEYAQTVASILEKLEPAPMLHFIEPDHLSLGEKEDAYDFIENLKSDGAQPDEIKQVLGQVLAMAEPLGGAGEVHKLIEAMIRGDRRAEQFPWPRVGGKTKLLLPGTVTLICGAAGDGKSLWLLQCCAYWQEQGIKWALYALEEARDFHLSRMLAQRAQDSKFLDDEWFRNSKRDSHTTEYIARVQTENAEFLNACGRCITIRPLDKMVTLAELLEWSREQAKRGCRIICIDPITAAVKNGKPWEKDAEFMLAIESIGHNYDCSFILITHPPRQQFGGGRQAGGGGGGLAGGQAFERFSHGILYFYAHQLKKTKLIEPMNALVDAYERDINRTILIGKDRVGRGKGERIGYYYDEQTLRFGEEGWIKPREGKK